MASGPLVGVKSTSSAVVQGGGGGGGCGGNRGVVGWCRLVLGVDGDLE